MEPFEGRSFKCKKVRVSMAKVVEMFWLKIPESEKEKREPIKDI